MAKYPPACERYTTISYVAKVTPQIAAYYLKVSEKYAFPLWFHFDLASSFNGPSSSSLEYWNRPVLIK